MALASAQKRMMLISRAGAANTDRLTGVATMDGYVMRGLARWQRFSVLVRCKCPLGNFQTLSDKISEHPEFGAARGCRPPGQDQGPVRLLWRERPNHNITR
jgi:hypothetical protein